MIKITSLYTRYFFVTMAVFFIAMAAIGFGEDYNATYNQHIPIFWFAHVHGAILTGWLMIFLYKRYLPQKAI